MTTWRGGFASRGRGGFSGGDFPPARGRGGFGRGGVAPFGRGQPVEREPSFPAPSGPPSGPRNFTAPPFRPSNNRTTTTVPQTLRFDSSGQAVPETPTGPRAASTSSSGPAFRRPGVEAGAIPSGPSGDRGRDARRPYDSVNAALAGLPEILPHGQKALPVADRSRLDRLEEEAEKLRLAIQEKEARKRKGLREWDRLVREGESAAFRSEVAEASVRGFEGEGDGIGAAF